ncbi:MAG: tyrosine-protein kinase domain-containing protein [Candidatus Dormibacteria bacterium]
MQPQQLRKLARRWALAVALVTLVAGIAGFAVARHSTPIYQAQASVLVIAGPQASNNSAVSLSPDQATATAAALMVEPPMLQQVINELHLGVTTDELAKQVTATPQTSTELVDVTVQDPSPAKAALIDNTLTSDYSASVINQNQLRINKLGAALLKQITDQSNILATEETQLATADRKHADTSGITAEINATSATLSQLTDNYSVFQSTQAQNLVTVSVAAPASVPVTPVSPKVLLDTLLALFAGLLVGLGIAAAFEYFDQGLHTEQEVRERLGVTCLAIVPRFEPNQRSAASKRRERNANEAYSRLRTNLLFAELEGPLRTIVITSSRAGEGKTRTATNLAISLAATEKSVVLLDADMHRPAQHRVFGRPMAPGMSDMLIAPTTRGAPPLLDKSFATSFRHLSLVTSGVQPPNPSELLASPRIAALVRGLEFQRDVVVIDTPPVQAVTDALSISAHASGVIIVVESGKTNADQVRAVIESLHKVGAKVLGVVLNKATQRSMRSYYYYDYAPLSEKAPDVIPMPPPPPPTTPERGAAHLAVNGEAQWPARTEKDLSIERSEIQ